MPIAFSCPHCQRELRAFDHLVGRVLTCPGCRKPFNVPALGQGNPPATFVETVYLGPRITVLPPQPAAAPTPAEAAPVPAEAEATPGLAAAAVGGVAAVGAVAALASSPNPSQLAAATPPVEPDVTAAPEVGGMDAGLPPPPPEDGGAEFAMSSDLSPESGAPLPPAPDATGDQPLEMMAEAAAPGPEVELTEDMLVPGDASADVPPPSDAPSDSSFEQSFELTEDGSSTSNSASGEDMQLMEDILREEGDQSALG